MRAAPGVVSAPNPVTGRRRWRGRAGGGAGRCPLGRASVGGSSGPAIGFIRWARGRLGSRCRRVARLLDRSVVAICCPASCTGRPCAVRAYPITTVRLTRRAAVTCEDRVVTMRRPDVVPDPTLPHGSRSMRSGHATACRTKRLPSRPRSGGFIRRLAATGLETIEVTSQQPDLGSPTGGCRGSSCRVGPGRCRSPSSGARPQ